MSQSSGCGVIAVPSNRQAQMPHPLQRVVELAAAGAAMPQLKRENIPLERCQHRDQQDLEAELDWRSVTLQQNWRCLRLNAK